MRETIGLLARKGRTVVVLGHDGELLGACRQVIDLAEARRG